MGICMNTSWNRIFHKRMADFERSMPRTRDGIAVSIKIRVTTGCYHRSCCPHAYSIIDRELSEPRVERDSFVFQEHESGPEILVYLAVTSAGATLAASIINLITTIIKARFEGAKRGDRHPDPVELIVRRTIKPDEVREETVLRFSELDQVTREAIATELSKAVSRLLKVPRSE
jgi:hypothetical protein